MENLSFDEKTKGLFTPLMLKLISEILETSKPLFLSKKDIEDINIKNKEGWTALMFASRCSSSSVEKVQALIDAKADVNATNKNNWAALMMAARDRRSLQMKRVH